MKFNLGGKYYCPTTVPLFWVNASLVLLILMALAEIVD
jgi:hypothetical protein